MAQSTLSAKTIRHCVVDLGLNGKTYPGLRLSIIAGQCCDLIIGLNFQQQHQSITFLHGGPKPLIGSLLSHHVESRTA